MIQLLAFSTVSVAEVGGRESIMCGARLTCFSMKCEVTSSDYWAVLWPHGGSVAERTGVDAHLRGLC